jgi:hypothetical protein
LAFQNSSTTKQLLVRPSALEDHALVLLLTALALALLVVEQSKPRRNLEHLADALVGLGRALDILLGLDLLADSLALNDANHEHDCKLCRGVMRRTAGPMRLCFRLAGGRGELRIGDAWFQLTSSGEIGFWFVLRSSSMVFWSYRRSFLHPTRM